MRSGNFKKWAEATFVALATGLVGCAVGREGEAPDDDQDPDATDVEEIAEEAGDQGDLGPEVEEGFDPGDAPDGGRVGTAEHCQVCEDDSECAPDYFCLELHAGGQRVCLRSCDEELPECPPRFDCVESRIRPLPTPVCAPVGERCCVDADNDDYGAGVGCQGPDCDDNDADINPERVEICDGRDNNCDLDTDEGNPGGGLVCVTGLPGACSSGVTTCEDGAVICRPTASTLPESCDGVDNNCNGWVDEDEATLRALTRECYDGPPGTEGVGACRVGVQTCAGGEYRECVGQILPAPERCDGIDEDCDGVIDNGDPGGGIACVAPLPGICSAGRTRCVGGAVTCVNTVAPDSHPEVCDSLDNDCDGAVDEGFALGQVCTAGVGACLRSGITLCNAAGTDVECNAVPGTPQSETCNRIDDNCDGTTDEGFAYSGDPLNPGVDYPLGAACAVGRGACRRGGVVVCASGGASAVCDAPVVPPAPETCNYIDDDCDGRTDNGFVNAGGLYFLDTHCGACGIDCTAIYARPGAFGTCQVSGNAAACVMNCNSGFFNLNGVPDDGCEFRLDAGAIYVSGEDRTAADSPGCGLGPTATGGGRFPCRTIAYGISRATATGRTRVLVADALYIESVTVVAGVSLLGGYRADTWERHLTTTLTTVRAPTGPGHRKTIIATDISMPTTVEGFVIDGTAATTPGANSYAVYVNGGTSALTISNNIIYADSGAPGTTGAAGSDGESGVSGSPGQDAFDTNHPLCNVSRAGPSGGTRICAGTNVSGGAGGGAYCPPYFSRAQSSRPGAWGSGPAGGAGGAAGYDGATHTLLDSCQTCVLPRIGGVSVPMAGGNGGPGGDGSNGVAGAGATSALGSVVANEWVGAAGSTGGAGGHGSGGGGGGSGGGGDGLPDLGGCEDVLGATGGGGGSGGCGGTGGHGGGPGGGSFGIFVVNAAASPPTLTGNTIYRGFGGTGGHGGRGGTGGRGGAGAAGGRMGSGEAFCSGAGGHGGNGGHGGHGGGGGGGAGGVSYGIYVQGRTGYGAGTNTFPFSGGGGAGGSGGSSLGTPGNPGVPGAEANTN